MEHLDKKITAHIVFAVVILLVLGLASGAINHASAERPDATLHQVLLLANDQVFYGKLHDVNSRTPFLTDIYYLNAQQPQLDKQGRPIGGGGQKFTVVKRGYDEIHQPTDKLYFPRENILYWENVGADSLVARGIAADKEYRKGLAEKAAE